jgi:hypothetical protein
MEVNSLYRSFVVAPTVLSAPVSAVTDSVDTLLPQGSQSVAPVGAVSTAGATDNGSGAGGQSQASSSDTPGQSQTVAKFTRDAATNTLVFMEVDPQTQAVVVQFPDEQSLKLKSYLAEVQRHEESTQKSSPGSGITKTL